MESPEPVRRVAPANAHQRKHEGSHGKKPHAGRGWRDGRHEYQLDDDLLERHGPESRAFGSGRRLRRMVARDNPSRCEREGGARSGQARCVCA